MGIKLFPEKKPWVHPWAERRESFPQDIFLRANGWELVDRPEGKDALWRHPPDRNTFTHTQALSMAHEAMAREMYGV